MHKLNAFGLWGEDFWECGSSFAKGSFNRAWEFGTGFCESAGFMGSWLNADLDYEYCGDCTTFNEKMTQSWKTLQDYSTAFAEAPMSSLGSLLAPGVMKAYHLDSNASLSEQWSPMAKQLPIFSF